MRKTLYNFYVAMFCLPLLGGCGSSEPITNEPPPQDPEIALKELAEVYHYIHTQRNRVPKRSQDLAEYEGSLPSAMMMIETEEIVVRWGVGYAKGSSEVLAYQKDAPSNGGQVLLRDGRVKTMSAGEFQAARS